MLLVVVAARSDVPPDSLDGLLLPVAASSGGEGGVATCAALPSENLEGPRSTILKGPLQISPSASFTEMLPELKTPVSWAA
jgi:hypothetical protein